MDFSKSFTIEDLLAYFVPGIFDLLGIILLLLIPSLNTGLSQIKPDLFTGFIFIGIAYGLGSTLGGISIWFFGLLSKFKLFKDPRNAIQLVDYHDEVMSVIQNLFPNPKIQENEYRKEYFYLIRSLIQNLMPKAYETISRQNALRQLGENLIPAVLIWMGAGIAWDNYAKLSIGYIFGQPVSLTIGSILVGVLFLFFLYFNITNNRRREARELFTALLIGYHTGIIGDKKTQN